MPNNQISARQECPSQVCFGQPAYQIVTASYLVLVLTVILSSIDHADTGVTEFNAANNRLVNMFKNNGVKFAAEPVAASTTSKTWGRPLLTTKSEQASLIQNSRYSLK